MILVTVGTSTLPFDRLLKLVDDAGIDDELLVQHGASSVRPRCARAVDFLPFEALVQHVETARAVITHAGVGSVLTGLSAGLQPIVVPRRAALREAVDDHQLEFAARLRSAGMISVVERPDSLRDAVANAIGGGKRPDDGDPVLARELRAYLDAKIDPPHAPA